MQNDKKREQTINFGAGPSAIPDKVLRIVQEELLNWRSTGVSILEISHRSKEFEKLTNQVKCDLIELMQIPESYEILFLPGGASSQFSMVPLNLLQGKKSSEYFLTGYWSRRAILEAQKFSDVNICASGENSKFTTIPAVDKWVVNQNSAYIHYTANETIEGIEFDFVPDYKNIPVVADMSSNLLSKPIDVSAHSLIYSGAQKNIGTSGLTIVLIKKDLIVGAASSTPTMFDYETHYKTDSKYNTPPVFNIYLAGLVIRWILENGGLQKIADHNNSKAKKLYDFIDKSDLFFNRIDPQYRSTTNVTFHIAEGNFEEKFIQEVENQGLLNLKGHRSIGGMRASLYNAISLEDVERLVYVMGKFQVSG